MDPISGTMHPAFLYKPLDNHAVQCHLCRRRCKIASGKSAYCRTRKNLEGKLLIERANYRILQYHLDGTCCGYCGHPIAGYF